MRNNRGSDLLDGFQVGSQIGGRIMDGYRFGQDLDYRKKRDAIADQFRREEMDERNKDRDLRRQQASLQLQGLTDALDERKRLRRRQQIVDEITAGDQEQKLQDKAQQLRLKAPTAPQIGALPSTDSDPMFRTFQQFDAMRSQIKNSYAIAQANGDIAGMQEAAQKLAEWNGVGQGIVGAMVRREAKKKPPIEASWSDDDGTQYKGSFNSVDEARQLRGSQPLVPLAPAVTNVPPALFAAPKTTSALTAAQVQALAWANANPNDSRAKEIKRRMGQ